MKATFNVDRERHNKLFYKEYQNDSCVFQFHSHIELYFVDDGEMDFIVNNHHRTLKGGEMSVALSYDSHAYKTPVYSKSSVFIIPVYMCESFIQATKHKKSSYPFITDTEKVKMIKGYIGELKRENINEVERIGYIHVILGIVMDSVFLENNVEALNAELSAKILYYLNENFKNDISLDTISNVFGYNKSYLSRYFSSCFGVGFNQYLTSLRLKNALVLMNEKKNSLTHCAMESGFNSMRTFYRVFSSEFHISPKEYMDRTESYNSLEKIERKDPASTAG